MMVLPITNQGPQIPTEGILFWEDYAVPNCNVTGSRNVADLTNTITTGSLLAGASFNAVSASMGFIQNTAYINTNFKTALTNFTCVAIYKCNSSTATGNYQRIVDKTFATGFWLGREGSSANTWGGGIRQGGSPFGIYSSTFTDGQWQMIATTRTGATQKLWNKGTVVASQNGDSGALSADSLNIGRDPGVAYNLGGYITAVLIYNRELTPAEMTQIYQYYSLRVAF
jgi:hypothetical protein